MKRFLTALFAMVMLLSVVSCDKTTERADEDVNTSLNGTVAVETTVETTTADDEKTEVIFKEDEILFYSEDRHDIEGDRNTVYCYNYKGELLSSDNSLNMACYGDCGLAPAKDPSSRKIGFVDRDGVFVIDPIYDDAAPFSHDGIALVCIEEESENGRDEEKCGYINSKGEEIVPCIYDDATSFFNSGYAIVGTKTEKESDEGYTTNEWSYGVIDKTGKLVVEKKYPHITCVYDGYMLCNVQGEGTVVADFAGNILDRIDENAEGYGSPNVQSYGITEKGICKTTKGNFDNEKYTYEVLKVEYFNGKEFTELKEEYEITSKHVATTSSGKGYGVSKGGKTVIPYEYDKIESVGSYFVGINYINGEYKNQIIDIYDSEFNMTAKDINYSYYHRDNPYSRYGDSRALPDGYFDVYVYKNSDEQLHGIIDQTGKFILDPVYYRGINLYTYEGMGKFYVEN